MLRSRSLFARPIVSVVLILLVALAAWQLAPHLTMAQSSPEAAESPSSDTEPDVTPIVINFDEATGTPPVKHLLYLTTVIFEPGDSMPAQQPHAGDYILTVDEGAVCYEQGDMSPGTVVTVTVPLPHSSSSGCGESPDLACEDDEPNTGDRTCTLAEDDVIYLPTGSYLKQTGNALHKYGNVDSTRAVVYLAGYEVDDGDVGCGGTCS